ncbi:MAG: hypothetical protein YK1309IOTA_210003 [Marine Group I thaumarchaeote]|nr:MAG: hypothetical protein YK1309IOTA_210003 [Marine Group I thaumarchaeote]
MSRRKIRNLMYNSILGRPIELDEIRTGEAIEVLATVLTIIRDVFNLENQRNPEEYLHLLSSVDPQSVLKDKRKFVRY